MIIFFLNARKITIFALKNITSFCSYFVLTGSIFYIFRLAGEGMYINETSLLTQFTFLVLSILQHISTIQLFIFAGI